MTIDLEQLRIKVEAAANKWLKDHENIEEYIYRILSRNLDDIIKAAIGFRKDSWRNEWEVNVINLANDKSAFGRECFRAAEVHARRIVAELAENYETSFTDKEIAKMQAYYRKRLSDNINELLDSQAQSKAEQMIDEVLDTHISTRTIDDNIKSRIGGLSEEKKLAVLNLIEGDDDES